MSLPTFDASCGVTGAIIADLRCRILAHATTPALAQENAATTGAAISALAAAGEVVGLGRLEMIVVKAASKATATALRPDRFLRVDLDSEASTAPAEKALTDWALSRSSAAAAAPSRAGSPPTPTRTPPVLTPVTKLKPATTDVLATSECELAFASLEAEMDPAPVRGARVAGRAAPA